MLGNSYSENVKHGFLQEWDNVAKCKKPIIAAVNGYAVSLTRLCIHISPQKMENESEHPLFQISVCFLPRVTRRISKKLSLSLETLKKEYDRYSSGLPNTNTRLLLFHGRYVSNIYIPFQS